MIEFKKVKIHDKDWVDPIIKAENTRSADYNFGNIYMWDSTFRQKIAPFGDRLLIKLKYEDCPFFAFPIGSGDIRPAIDFLTEFTAKKGYPLAFRGVTEEHKALLEEAYPGRFSFKENRDRFDYIYLAEKLATHSGKKLHAKRNFCNRFEKTRDWEFLKLTSEHLPFCMKMLGEWQSGFEFPPEGLEDEHSAIIRGFMRYKTLGLKGGVLKADGVIIGFTIGEIVSTDTFNVHFEKAFASVPGAYPMVCREFVRMIMADNPNIKYINREDDLGIPSLRTSKLSYYPEYLLKKYIVTEKDDDGTNCDF